MKKKIIIPIIIIAVITTAAGGFFISKNSSYNKMIETQVFPKNTKLEIGDWNMYISHQNAQKIYEQYIEEQEEKTMKITLGNKNYELDIMDCVTHSLKEEDIAELIEGISLNDYISSSSFNFELKDKINCDTDKIVTKFSDFLKNTNYSYVEAKDAYFDEENLTIVEEIKGTQIDEEKAIAVLKDALSRDVYEVNLDNEDLYKTANITKSDIEKEYADILKVIEWSASYSVSDYVISMKDYKNFITLNEDKTCTVDTSFMKEAVLALSKTIDNQGAERTFNSTLDGEIKVKGGTYGQCMSNAEEIKYLIEKLELREPVENREPVWIVDPKTLGDEKTYIEIDLSAQHVWLYEDGKLVMDTDCVTGTDNTTRATPTGSYFISERVNGKYLRGATWNTWVDKWMRLTPDGVGLHDASWRGKFGGNIYKTDGSHGCINLPKQFAYDLYDKTKVGMLVIVHE